MWIAKTFRCYLRQASHFHEHLKKKIKICNKLIGTIKHLSVHLPRKSLLIIYKSFVWPHHDHGDIIYDNPLNGLLINKLQNVQYQSCLTITGAIQGISREILYKELGLESLQSRRWYRNMIFFHKILNNLTPKYLFDNITDVTIQELSQSWILLNSISKQKVSVTLSFPSVLKNGRSWMLKPEMYHPFPDSKIDF